MVGSQAPARLQLDPSSGWSGTTLVTIVRLSFGFHVRRNQPACDVIPRPSPSLTDVATNVLAAFLGVVIVVGRYNVKPQFTATRGIGTVAAALALLLILGVWKMSGSWPSDRLPDGQRREVRRKADYIDFGYPQALRLTSSMTISAWIKSSSFPRDDVPRAWLGVTTGCARRSWPYAVACGERERGVLRVSRSGRQKTSLARQRRLACLQRSRVLDCFHQVGRFDA